MDASALKALLYRATTKINASVLKGALAFVFLTFFLQFISMPPLQNENGIHCNCDDGFWITQIQRTSDIVIAAAYFFIPLQLLFFTKRYKISMMMKWVVFQFIAFIFLCGMTHFLNWYSHHHIMDVTVFKALTALASIVTAITLSNLIPMLLKSKARELMLTEKTCDLTREVEIIKKRNEWGVRVRMLTREIRMSVDRHTIIYTTLHELSKSLDSTNCIIWMPNVDGTEIFLAKKLRQTNTCSNRLTIPITDPDVKEIRANKEVKILNSDSVLAAASSFAGGNNDLVSVAAIRVPILKVSNFNGGTPKMFLGGYAILVLVLPDGRNTSWSDHERDMVEVVADQVGVALSHASVLEESMIIREKLVQQNRELKKAKQDALKASQVGKELKAVMGNVLRKHMQTILGLLSMMQQNRKLRDEQRLVVDTMVKTGTVVSNIIVDIMDTDVNRRLALDTRYFELHRMIKEAACLSKCLCACMGYDFAIEVDKSLPNRVMGDEKRVFQLILYMVGSMLNGGVKGGGGILVLRVYLTSGSKECNAPDGYAYVRVDVGICGRGSGAAEERMSFNRCKNLVKLMHGDIWMIPNPSNGLDQIMALVLQLQLQF